MMIALALVTTAAGWQQCTALNLAASAAPAIGHASHATNQHADVADHAHGDHATHAGHSAGDPVMPAADDHGCMKCCAMCTVANALPPVADATAPLTVSTHVFSRDQGAWTANTITVDPGIPKRIV